LRNYVDVVFNTTSKSRRTRKREHDNTQFAPSEEKPPINAPNWARAGYSGSLKALVENSVDEPEEDVSDSMIMPSFGSHHEVVDDEDGDNDGEDEDDNGDDEGGNDEDGDEKGGDNDGEDEDDNGDDEGGNDEDRDEKGGDNDGENEDHNGDDEGGNDEEDEEDDNGDGDDDNASRISIVSKDYDS
jgi:hypothetical protein